MFYCTVGIRVHVSYTTEKYYLYQYALQEIVEMLRIKSTLLVSRIQLVERLTAMRAALASAPNTDNYTVFMS